jgi:hypothetical protein
MLEKLKHLLASQNDDEDKVFMNYGNIEKISSRKLLKQWCAIGGFAIKLRRKTSFLKISFSMPKTRSVFDRYNIVNDTDLREAAQRQEAYLQGQNGYKTVTIADFGTKKGLEQNA